MNKEPQIKQFVQSLFEVAEDNNVLDQTILELQTVSKKLRLNPDIKTFLSDPTVKLDQKKESLNLIFKESISNYTYNYLFILVEKNLINYLSFSIRKLKELYNKKNNVLRVVVTSVYPLEESVQNKITEKIASATSKKVLLKNEIDKSIIGGLIFKFDNHLIDASLAAKVSALEEKLSK